MDYDYNTLEEKKKELTLLVEQSIPDEYKAESEIVRLISESFIRVTPPKEPEIVIEYINTFSGGRGGGRSRKPGNIFLNWRKLIKLIPDITIASVNTTTTPSWLLPFIALSIWNKLWSNANEELTREEATIILTLWKNRNSKNRISDSDGYERTNTYRKLIKLPLLSKSEYDQSINKLLTLRCIELNDGIIWLREWVRDSY